MKVITLIVAAILTVACSLKDASSSTGAQTLVSISIAGVEYRSMDLSPGESKMNRLAVCAPPDAELHGEAQVGDSLVARSTGVSFAANDTVDAICKGDNLPGGREARVNMNGVNTGDTQVSVSIWADPRLRSPESFKVLVKAP